MTIGFAAALLIGISLGLIGGGGSILTVPVFVYLIKIPPTLATAYSLFVVGSAAAVGAWRFLRVGDINLTTAAIFGAPSVVAVYATRQWLMPAIPETIVNFGSFELGKSTLIMGVFALVMLAASLSMLKSKNTHKPRSFTGGLYYLVIAFEGFIVGGVTGFVGAGGGFLIVPALVIVVGLPMKTAIGSSLSIIAVKSLIGFIGDINVGTTIDWSLLLPFTGIAVLGIFGGSFLANKIDGSKLKKGFGIFVLVMALAITYKEFFEHLI